MEFTRVQLKAIADLIAARAPIVAADACRVADEIGQALEQTGHQATPRWR